MANVIKAHDNLGPAADCLTAGGLALVPTETVYGVGVAISAFAANLETPGPDTGYGRIFTLKQRELTQTVPWLVDGPAAPRALRQGCASFDMCFGGKALAGCPHASWSRQRTTCRRSCGLRMGRSPACLASPVVQELIARCGSPLAVTSANTHGKPGADFI